MDIRNRIKQLFIKSQTKKPLEAIIIKNQFEPFIDLNFFYTTGLTEGLFEGCCLVLFPDGTMHVLVSELEHDIAQSIDATIHTFQKKETVVTQLQEILTNTTDIGLNYSGLLYSEYEWFSKMLPRKTFYDITTSFHLCRMIKDTDELNRIRKACRIADRVMEHIRTYIKQNMTENDLAAEIDYHLQKYGAHHPAFETIASFGPHTALPHYTHKETTLQKGDFILCDFGACCEKYHSDMTRTFVFGAASEKQKHIHNIVLQAQAKGITAITPGISADTIHQIVHSYINQTAYKGRFIHSTGHSLGLAVHDPGIALSDSYTSPLQENMVLTVEPGIYLPGFGGVRIEDNIAITKDGCEVLTTTDRTLLEV